MKRLLLISLAAATLAACETVPTAYQPAAPGRDTVGYTEYRIEPGRYRITFRGGPGAPPEQVSDYALLRAADLALSEGYDWFRVSDRFLEGRPDKGPRVSFGIGGASIGRHTGVGVGVGTSSMSLGGGPAVSSTIEVVMGKGERPRGADIYDARGIRQSIGPRA
jgi:hypothetical protein